MCNITWKHMDHAQYKLIEVCYIAGNFPLIARAIIGQFGITWHLTMKLFPAKSLWAGNIAKSITSEGNNAMFPQMLTKDRRCTWTECDWRWCDHSVWPARFSKEINKFLIVFPLGLLISSLCYTTNYLMTGPSGNQLILFPSNLSVSLGSASGNIEILGKQN